MDHLRIGNSRASMGLFVRSPDNLRALGTILTSVQGLERHKGFLRRIFNWNVCSQFLDRRNRRCLIKCLPTVWRSDDCFEPQQLSRYKF